MHDLFPEGEDMRRAVKWVSAKIQENPGEQVRKLVQEAIFKFDLSPKDAEFIMRFFSQGKGEP